MKKFKFYEAMLNKERRKIFFDGINAIEEWTEKITVALLAITCGLMLLICGEHQLPFSVFTAMTISVSIAICFAMEALKEKVLAPVHLFEVAGYQNPSEVSYDANRLLTTVAYHYMEDARLFLEKKNKPIAFVECYKHAKQQAKAAKVMLEEVHNVYEVACTLTESRKAFVESQK